MTTEVRIRLRDALRIRYCRDGVEAFCSRNGIDFTRMLREGIPEEEVAGLDDIYVQRLIQAAKERCNGR